MNKSAVTPFNRFYRRDLKLLINDISGTDRVVWIETETQLGKLKKTNNKYIVLVNLIGDIPDVQGALQKLHSFCTRKTRIVITYYNYIWEPILSLAETLGFKKKKDAQNWLTLTDIENLLTLSDFEVIRKGQRLLLPINIPFVSPLFNHVLAKLPLISKLCLTNYIVAKPINIGHFQPPSVSIIIPARNEAGNIAPLIKRLPKIAPQTELIFVEGHSKDWTWQEIEKSQKRDGNITAYKQMGIGKADAVHLGVSHSRSDIIIILDADLSVPPEDIPKFYEVLVNNRGEFINGSRLVYPLEKESMRFLNRIGNKLFSLMFSWLLNQRFTDTLCGTKAFYREDYLNILKLRKVFGDFDPFGDFELIFGAVKLNLKVVEIPIRYHARVYGTTNISRFTHGLLLLKMWFFALRKFKFGKL